MTMVTEWEEFREGLPQDTTVCYAIRIIEDKKQKRFALQSVFESNHTAKELLFDKIDVTIGELKSRLR